MRWYVVQTQFKKEDMAQWNLRAQGFTVYCPMINDTTYVFGGYVFVQMDIDTCRWRSINGTRGCKRVMCMDPEMPSPIPNGMIEEMMRQDANGGFVKNIEKAFAIGDRLKILDGPLTGHVGECIATTKGRIQLLLHILGGENKVYLNDQNLELAR